jgi:hypothetical protein
VYPACNAAEVPRANWLTLRRTFSTWSHQPGIPVKDIAEMMEHADVDMQFTYTVGVDENKRQGGTYGQFSKESEKCPKNGSEESTRSTMPRF